LQMEMKNQQQQLSSSPEVVVNNGNNNSSKESTMQQQQQASPSIEQKVQTIQSIIELRKQLEPIGGPALQALDDKIKDLLMNL